MEKELRKIRQNLIEKSEKEATKLYRLAWKAQAHGCKRETIYQIREEARWLHETGTAYPERIISPYTQFKYAFR